MRKKIRYQVKQSETRLCVWLVFLCFGAQAFGQERLFVRATPYPDAVAIHFFPMKPADWTRDVASGYRIVRVEVDSATSAPKSGTEHIVASAAKPQSAQWFEQHQADEEGLMQAIGALLYDTLFQFKDRSLIDPDSMRWNYVMYEVLNRPYVALATGFLVADTTAIAGKTYRYDLSHLTDPGLRTSFILTPGSSSVVQLPANFDTEFQFPENKSLSDMIPKLEKPIMPQVVALAKAYGDSIALRWAPSSAQMWFSSNQKGYVLVKYIETKPDQFEVVDTIGLIKPWTREKVTKWLEINPQDSLAFMAAGILYNELPGEILPVSEQAQVFQTKYGFALFAAEGSALAAQILGLGYIDKKVQRGKTYAYRVIAIEAPSAFSQGDAKIKNELLRGQKPEGFQAISGDRLIELKWLMIENRARYSAYQLERAVDKNNDWKALHQGPLTFVDSDVASFSEYAFRDSVTANYVKFRYRLRGLDSFGDWSEWTEVVSEAVDLTPPVAPSILLASYNDTTNIVTIKWEVFEIPDDFKNYKVMLAKEADGPYDITLAELKSDAREFIWKPDSILTADRGFFIRVVSEDIHKNQGVSIERMMVVPDLVAPPAPALVVGNISEEGLVSLVWEHSTAPDVRGYHVVWANSPDHEFSQHNTKLIEENAYEWTIEIESLTENLYVAVAAQDNAFNRGANSKMIQLKRPDKVPPIPARMVSVVQNGKAIELKWEPSPSTDVTMQYLLRRLSGNQATDWQLIDSMPNLLAQYTDTTCAPQEQYSYTIYTKDESQNKSENSNALHVKTRFSPDAIQIKGLTINQVAPGKVELTWDYQTSNQLWIPKGQAEFLIHRSTGSDHPKLIGRANQDQRMYMDSGLINGVLYNYMVQVFFKDAGETGKPSPIKSVFGKAEPVTAVVEGVDVKLVVKGNNRTILSGDEFPTLDDKTDFGIVGTGTKLTHGFSLNNTGTGKLRLPSTSITLETTDVGVWKVIQPESQVITGYGGTENFIIEFQPKLAQIYTAKVKVGGKTPYEFSIKGEGTSKAELDVTGRDETIVNGQAYATKTNDSDFEVVQTGNDARHIFKIKNIGATQLTLKSEPRLIGDAVFSISGFKMPVNGKIAPGAEVILTIIFAPKETGAHQGRVYILTDDEDESQFDFAIGGVGSGPEINVSGGLEASAINDGATEASEANGTSFGKVALNTAFTRTFTIRNSGSMALSLSGKPRVNISGVAAGEFKLVQEPTDVVGPGDGTTVFKIAFTPKSLGKKLVRAYLETNDINEGIFEFVLDGEGAEPAQLNVTGLQNKIIKNGQTAPLAVDGTDFGIIKKDQEVTREYQLMNKGGADYRIADVILEGKGAPFFQIVKKPDLIIKAGTKGTAINIQFKPETPGKYPVTLTIISQNSNEPAFQFSLVGMCSEK